MKRSKSIPLLMLGSLSMLSGCGPAIDSQPMVAPLDAAAPMLQNHYGSKEECVADWGSDERDCTPQATQPPIRSAKSYASLKDCRDDWSSGERDCAPTQVAGSGYAGPHYIWSHGMGYPTAYYSDGTSRAMPNSYLARGNQSLARAFTAAPTRSFASGRFVGSTSHASAFSSGARATSRGGFGGIARGISGGG